MNNSVSTTVEPLSTAQPTIAQALGYGILAVTVTNLAALSGLLFAPLSKCSCYPSFISFMVATAVGSLFSSSVLVLIPEALHLANASSDITGGNPKWYLPLCVAVCAGSLLFFTMEFMLRRIRSCLECRSCKRDSSGLGLGGAALLTNGCCIPVTVDRRNCADFPYRLREPVAFGDQCMANALPSNRPISRDSHKTVTLLNGHVDESAPNEHVGCCGTQGCSPTGQGDDLAVSPVPRLTFTTPQLCTKLGKLDPVVWMIVVGDGVHNFMDGLSIGAGFSHSISLGFSLTLAVLCEELPHELGDIAILLRSGLSVPLAVAFNFASACTAYIGLLVGVFVGELSSAAVYIFALTAGFFLYIALADMLPEMRSMEDTVSHDSCKSLIRFAVHCGGMIFGFLCILTVVLTSDLISF